MAESQKPIPIYTTSGDTGGYLVFPYVYNQIGDWIGWVTKDNQVYSVYGRYVGWVNKDNRILCRRADDFQKPDKIPPPAPARFLPPATVPLPPLMAELKYETVDVLEDMPELMPRLDDFAVRDDEFE
ncbi:MAG: hypothetical protein JSV69_02680 [Chloroflexota bacterium]|nr:MAG: hypothetical protein JSV69_02680 [Chloroflexota bacterium]UCF27378.1 MAG: hypothetical protein JSW42_12150 [Chloroflexota bacterium]